MLYSADNDALYDSNSAMRKKDVNVRGRCVVEGDGLGRRRCCRVFVGMVLFIMFLLVRVHYERIHSLHDR